MVVVGVLPIRPQHTYDALRESDLEIITQGGHGKGGQHQNATDSAVRMKHVPTGITVFINGRSQHDNKRVAREILTMRVNDLKRAEQDAEYAEVREAQMGDSGRADKDRTYNFINSRITDHRHGTKTGNVKAVMKGEFNLLFPKG